MMPSRRRRLGRKRPADLRDPCTSRTISRVSTTMSLQLNARPATLSAIGAEQPPHRFAPRRRHAPRSRRAATAVAFERTSPTRSNHLLRSGRLDHSVDAGRAERARSASPCAPNSPDEGLERGFRCAIVRVGRGRRVIARSALRRRGRRRRGSKARRRASRRPARAASRSASAAVDIRCQKRGEIIALAAAIAPGHMLERRMDEHVRAVDQRGRARRRRRARRRSIRCCSAGRARSDVGRRQARTATPSSISLLTMNRPT